MYFQNAGEADFIEIVPVLFIFTGIGLLFYFLSLLICKSKAKATIISTIFTGLVLNFVFFENALKLVFNRLWYWHTVPILIVIAFYVSFIIFKKMKKEIEDIVITGLSVMIFVLILINIITGVPKIIEKNQNKIKPNESNLIEASSSKTNYSENLPNMYILIWDEMASFKQMEDYYNYKNNLLIDFLKLNSFTISEESYGTTPFTHREMANLVNYDYVLEKDTPDSETWGYIKQGNLFKLLTNYGYKVQIISEGTMYPSEYQLDIFEVNSNAKTMTGETLFDLLLSNTIIYPIFISRKQGLSELDNTYKIIDYLSDKKMTPIQPTVTFVHINFPHAPHLVDENGNKLVGINRNEWVNDEIYKGQYIYASKLMIKVLENLIENDPESLIISMSDHGARAGSTDLFMKKFSLKDMCRIFNTFYYNNEDLSNFKNYSAVNTLRLFLNKILNTNLEILKEPDYE